MTGVPVVSAPPGVLRFNVGLVFIEGRDSMLEEEPGDFVHVWVPEQRASAGRDLGLTRHCDPRRSCPRQTTNPLRQGGFRATPGAVAPLSSRATPTAATRQ